jgi:signal transduction histidine kinase/sugar lactone lactonase YvrE
MAALRPFLLVLVGVLLFASSALPQEAADSNEPLLEEWRWARFTTRDGLPSNIITEVREAPDGTAWVATAGGLAWYDGWLWHGVPPADGAPVGAVSSMTVDAAGEVWAIAGSGLHRGGRDGFRPVPMPDGVLAPGSVVRLPGGGVLVLAGSLLDRKRSLLRLVSGQLRPIEPPVPSSWMSENGLHETGSGRVWLWTTRGEFSWSEGGWCRWLPFESTGTYVGQITEGPGGSGIAGIEDPVRLRGLWEWDPGGPPRRAAVSFAGDLAAAAVAQDGKVVALFREGDVLVRRQGRWLPLSPAPEALRDASLLRFRANGDLWTATPAGLFLCHLRNRRWTHWSAPAGDLLGNRVNEIVAAKDGTIWLATTGGVVAHRPDGTPVPVADLGEGGSPVVTGLAEDREGRIWASSGSGFTGVRRWDGVRWQAFDRDDRGLPLGNTHKVRTDRNGRTWLLSLSSRTFDPDARDGTVHLVSDGLPTAWVEAAMIGGRRFYDVDVGLDGAIWFATSEGLDRWKDGAWRHWWMNEAGWPSKVQSVVATGDGGAWAGQRAGTRSGRLARIEPDGVVRYVMGESPHLASGVWGLSLDGRGRLWVATEAGLACIEDDCLSAFDRGQGLGTTNLWPVLSSGNRVYAGSRGGGTWILDTDEFEVPPPCLTPGQPVVDEDAAFLRWTVHPWWGTASPRAVLTHYRLDDSPWSAWSTDREVMLQRETRGEHTLTVQARGLLGRPTEGIPIGFRVRVPLLRMWEVQAALAGAVTALAAAGLLLLRRRQRTIETIRRSEARLLGSRDHLRALARRLQTVRDEEQVRISRDLHDDFGQVLTGLKLQLTGLRSRIPDGDVESRERADAVLALLDGLFQALQRISENLRPPLLEDLGLEGALERLVTEFSGRNAIEATVKCWLAGVEVDGDRALAAYRIVQEALTNVSRHSGASRVRVNVKEEEGDLVVQVADDGRGMGPESQDGKGSLGILGMRERAMAWGGEVAIRSAPGSGVEVVARIPLGAPAPGKEAD